MRRERLFTTMLVVAAVTLAANGVRAGKPERERVKELEGLIKTAKGEIKKACGCGTNVVGKWQTFAQVNDMFRCHDTVAAIAKASVGHCTDPESKKLFCKHVSSFEIIFSKEPDNTRYSKNKITTICSDMMYSNADQLKKILDKF